MNAQATAANDRDLQRLQDRLGYRFEDPASLDLALTHRSRSSRRNNERLEFLGDAWLGYVVADELYRRHPDAPESALTLARAALVRRATLAEVARSLLLGEHLRLGPGEMKSGGHRRASILSDAVEAIIGAVLLDGGEAAARDLVTRLLAQKLDTVRPDASAKDPKTRLQEFLQGKRRPLPRYTVIAEHGSEHAREFHVRCTLEDADTQGEGHGSSRRAAEQGAAAELLGQLGEASGA